MQEDNLKYMVCPICSKSGLKLCDPVYDEHFGFPGEVVQGTVSCACGKKYYISEYVLSLIDAVTSCFSIEDGEFWRKYYNQLTEQGIDNFKDRTRPYHPFYEWGLDLSCSPDILIAAGAPGEEYLRMLNNHLLSNAKAGAKVLEIGCGAGWLSLEMARRGWRVHGIDTNLESLKVAKQYSLNQGLLIEYVQADGGNPPFVSETFHNIVAFHSLHHIPQLQGVFNRYKDMLMNGGLMIAYDHIRESKLGRYIQERYIRVLVKTLQVKNKPVFSFKSGYSFHEDVSLGQLNLAERVFVKKHYEEEVYFLKFLPIFCYYIFGRSRLLLKTIRSVSDIISFIIGIIIPSTREFALGFWMKNDRENS